jgi:hypothetical protein
MTKKKYGRGKGKDDPRKAPQEVKPTTTPEEQDAARVTLEEKLRQKAARGRANETEVKASGKAKAVEPSPKVVNNTPADPKPTSTTEQKMVAEVSSENFEPKDIIGGETSPSTTAQVASEMTPGVDVEEVKKLSAGSGSDPLRPKMIDPDFEEVSEEEARAAEAAGLSAAARRGPSTVVNPVRTAPYAPPSSGDVAGLLKDRNYRVDTMGPGVANAPAVAESREDRAAKGMGTPGDELGMEDVLHNGQVYTVNRDLAEAYRMHRDSWESKKAKGQRAGREFTPEEMYGGHEHSLVRIARELGADITPQSVHAYAIKVAGKRGAVDHVANMYQILTKDRNSRKPALIPVGLNDTIQHPTETDATGNPLRMKVKDAAFHTAFSSHLKVSGRSPSGYAVERSEAAQPMIDPEGNPVFRHTGFNSIDTGQGKLHYYSDPSEYENYTPLKNRLRSEILSPVPAGSVRTGSGRKPLTSGRVTGYVPFSNPLQQIVQPPAANPAPTQTTGPVQPPRVGIQGDEPFYVSRTARRRNMISGDPGYVSGSELDGMYDKAERLQNFGAKREAVRASMGDDPTIVNHLNDQAAELTQSISQVHEQVQSGVFDVPHEDVARNAKGQMNRDDRGNRVPGVSRQLSAAAEVTRRPKLLQGVLDLGEGYDYPKDDYKVTPTYESDSSGGFIKGEGSTRLMATERPEDALLDVQTGKAITAGKEVAPKVMSRAEAGIPDSTYTPEHQRFSTQFNALRTAEPDREVEPDDVAVGFSKTDSFATNLGEKPKSTITIKGSVPLPSGVNSKDLFEGREDVRMGTQPLFAPDKVEQTSYKGFEEVKPEPREEVETPKSPYLPSGGVDYRVPEPVVTPVPSDPYQTSGKTTKAGTPIDYSTGRARKPERTPEQLSLFSDADLLPEQTDASALIELPATRRGEAFLGSLGKSNPELIKSVKSKDAGYKQITQSQVAAEPYSSPAIGDFIHHSRYGGGKVIDIRDSVHPLTGAPDKHVTVNFGGSADLHDIKPLALSEHSRFLEKVQPVETFDSRYPDTPEATADPQPGVSSQLSGYTKTSNMPAFTPKKSGKGR